MAEGNDLIRVMEEGPDRGAETIRKDIAARRDSISDTVDQLSDRVQAALDWRTYVAQHPFIAVGIAAGLGCTAATLLKSRSSPQDRIMDALAESVEDLAGRFRDGIGTLPLVRRVRIGRVLWSIGSAIATAAVSKKLKDAPVENDSRTEHRESGQSRFAARASSRGEGD
jgi:ElaB/YqjD/DUF883 family membrane-anchored ribosome-binding protein